MKKKFNLTIKKAGPEGIKNLVNMSPTIKKSIKDSKKIRIELTGSFLW